MTGAGPTLHVDSSNSALVRELIAVESLARTVAVLPADPNVRARLARHNTARVVVSALALDGIPIPDEAVSNFLTGVRHAPAPATAEHNALAFIRALEYVTHTLDRTPATRLTEALIRHLHELVTAGSSDEGNAPGRYRPDLEARQQIRAFVRGMNEPPANSWHPVVSAVAAQYALVTISPFAAGNGRVASLVDAFILYRGGIRVPGNLSLASVYDRLHREYDRLARAALASPGGDITALTRLSAAGLVAELESLQGELVAGAARTAFREHTRSVIAAAPGLRSASRERLLQFMLQLGDSGADLAAIRHGPHAVRALHSRLSSRTLARDLDDLKTLGLVAIENGRVRPRLEVVLGQVT